MNFAAAAAKRRYDGKHKPLDFKVGDQVYLRLHHRYHLPGRPSKKYSQQRSGPWTVVKKVGRLAYKLDFPETSRLYPVVSVAHLSATPGGADPFDRDEEPAAPVRDDQVTDDAATSAPNTTREVERIIDHRRLKSGAYKYMVKWRGRGHEDNQWRNVDQLRAFRSARRLEYLIKWKNYGHKDNTWEPLKHLRNCPEELAEFHRRNPDRPGLNQTTIPRLRGRPRNTRR